jgi:hypothetical protein
MKNIIICITLFAIILVNSSTFAEEETVDSTENECFDPRTQQWECVPKTPNIIANELTCSDQDKGRARFKLCNYEREPVTAVGIDRSSQNFMIQTDPTLPFTIESGQCIESSVQGIDRKDTVESCDPESKFCLAVNAKKKSGFDCSGDYGFGYDFENDSKSLVGLSGLVSLTKPKEEEIIND